MSSIFRPLQAVGLDALRGVGRLLSKLATTIGGTAGSTSAASDTTCDRLSKLSHTQPLITGVVKRTGYGSYDCEVLVDGGHTLVCSAIAPVLHDLYGASQVCMPAPGSTVLVYVSQVGIGSNMVTRGIILGVVPVNVTGGISTKGEPVITKIADTEFPEGGVAQFTEGGAAAIATDKKYAYKGEFSCGRPHDMVPGEYAVLQHSGAGLVIGAVSSSIRGSELASVRCSALDDQVRITSGHYRHINAAGSHEIYNDGGFISVESVVSMYQSERLGVKGENTPAFTWKTEKHSALKEVRSGITPNKKRQTAKKRLYRYEGYLGDIVNVFVANPDPDKDTEDMLSDSNDQGLFHQHIDSSGKFTVRSAAGILLERFDRIPIPKRNRYIWDPEGDKETTKPTAKVGFKHPVAYPMGIGITMADRAAWDDHLAYSRFTQFAKDFTVPDQGSLKCPSNNYDIIGNGTEEFQEYDTRHSYVGLTPDGGIVLRDAWGSEIVMADGRITLNAVANIEIRSGSSVVIMGGDDVITKAYNSVDISATEKDVHIKAENNMQIASMRGGVLIQSRSESDGTPSAGTGESVAGGGVVIKADKASVNVIGNKAAIQGASRVSLSAFNEDGEANGDIILSGRAVSVAAKDAATFTTAGTSGIIIDPSTAVLCAPSVMVAGGQNAQTVSGSKMMFGIPVDVMEMYSLLVTSCKSIAEAYIDSSEWLSPFQPKVLSEVEFTFRTSDQYGTATSSGVSGGEFSVYQPSWVAMAIDGNQSLAGVQTKAWEEKPDGKGGYPWPGGKAMESGSYVEYTQQNIDRAGFELPVSGEATLTRSPFKEYHIRERS